MNDAKLCSPWDLGCLRDIEKLPPSRAVRRIAREFESILVREFLSRALSGMFPTSADSGSFILKELFFDLFSQQVSFGIAEKLSEDIGKFLGVEKKFLTREKQSYLDIRK